MSAYVEKVGENLACATTIMAAGGPKRGASNGVW